MRSEAVKLANAVDQFMEAVEEDDMINNNFRVMRRKRDEASRKPDNDSFHKLDKEYEKLLDASYDSWSARNKATIVLQEALAQVRQKAATCCR